MDLAFLTQLIELRKDIGDPWREAGKGQKSDVKRAGYRLVGRTLVKGQEAIKMGLVIDHDT